MTKEVSEEEVLTLHQFCVKHRVVYYDVRVELVDHLATSIENLWEKQAELSFTDALNATYKSYGVMGFRTLMREKEEVVEKQFRRDMKHAFRSMFYWPNIRITLLLLLPCLFFYMLIDKGYAAWSTGFLYLMCIATILFEIGLTVQLYRRRKKMKYPLLCTQNYGFFSLSGVINFILIQKAIVVAFDGVGFFAQDMTKPTFVSFASICLVNILMLLARRKFMNDTFAQAKKQYPMVFEPKTANLAS